MFRNYIRTTYRNLLKFKATTVINILGLSIALFTTLVVYKWVNHELSYDLMHKDVDNIYRLVLEGNKQLNISSSYAVKRDLIDKIPEVKESVRLFKANFIGGRTKVAEGDKVFTDINIVYADKNFFKIFSFPLLHGEEENILEKPNAVVITETTAKKYFGKENVVGESLILSNSKILEITGVLKDIPSNSHIHFDMLATMEAHPWSSNFKNTNLGSGWIYYNYIKLNENSNAKEIPNKLDRIVAGLNLGFEWNNKFFLQPIKDIHLHSNGWNEFEANSNMTLVYVFITIGLFIIIVAGINYINLTTAVSIKRSKEMGIKKAIGAKRNQLIWSQLFDSIFIITISFIMAMVLYEISKPLMNYITGVSLDLSDNIFLILKLYLYIVVFGLIIGFIPALLLSKVPVVSLLHSKLNKAPTRFNAKNVLLTAQFCISIFLIIGTIVIYNQLTFIQNKNLGYDKEQTLVLYTRYDELDNKIETFKNILLQNSEISNVTSVSQIPSDVTIGEGVILPNGERIYSNYISVDNDFFKTLDVHVLEGEERINQVKINYQQDSKTRKNLFVVNKSFLKKMAATQSEAVNQEIVIKHGNMQPGPIIGVVDDFHFQSLHNPIGPLVLEFVASDYQHLLIKFKTKNVRDVINFVNDKWAKYAGNLPFEYQFLDDNYAALYEKEMRAGFLILLFSIISVVIGSIGIFGLSIFLAEQKIKEIGVRKILGASLFSLFLLLTRGFAKQVLVANIIAWPIAFYAMNLWLDNFAYKIDLGIIPFLLAGFVALSVTILIVSWQAIKAGNVNPVESLKNE